VTVPLLRVPDDGTPVYIKSNGAIFKAKENAKAKPGPDGKPLNPPELMEVTNLETGEIAQVVMNEVFATELRDKYPSDGYVNKSFKVCKFKMQGGKRYATFQITEIRVKVPDAQPEVKHETKPVSGHKK
jgi:hypothetical protein